MQIGWENHFSIQPSANAIRLLNASNLGTNRLTSGSPLHSSFSLPPPSLLCSPSTFLFPPLGFPSGKPQDTQFAVQQL